jgi:hypothetical protein
MDRKMVLLAVELPEPFFVPTVIEKSFTILFMELLYVLCRCEPLFGEATSCYLEIASPEDRRLAMT